jgi:hypothetical protein
LNAQRNTQDQELPSSIEQVVVSHSASVSGALTAIIGSCPRSLRRVIDG